MGVSQQKLINNIDAYRIYRIFSFGNHAKAREMQERALVIQELVYGKDDSRVASALSNLGSTISDAGDFAKAKVLQERALSITERIYGRDHGKVVIPLTEVAAAYFQLGLFEKARELQERALMTSDRVYGSESLSSEVLRTSLERTKKRESQQKRKLATDLDTKKTTLKNEKTTKTRKSCDF